MLPSKHVKSALQDTENISPVISKLRSFIRILNDRAVAQHACNSAGDGSAREPLDVVEAARSQWDIGLRYELRSIAVQCERPLLQQRTQNEPESFPSRLVYSWTDLLEALEALINPNASCTFSRCIGWGIIKLGIRTPTMSELRIRYLELQPNVRQVGLDDEIVGFEWFRNQQTLAGRHILLNTFENETNQIKKFAQTGIPASIRPQVWRRILGIWDSGREMAYYTSLIHHVRRWDIITDDLYRLEVQETSDHSEYFVFEDTLDEMMLAFSRDTWIPENCPFLLNTAPLASETSKTYEKNKNLVKDPLSFTIPPCQVVPFHRQVMLAAPFCYLFEGTQQVYYLFRQMYVKFFCRLHIISSRPDTILFLCKTFESLVLQSHPQACFHAFELDMPPLRIVFPWIFTAFSGYIPVDQVFVLWDRILAYDSLEFLPILAAAIFIYRSNSVLQAQSADEILDIFEDGDSFSVLPLLQHFLFP